MDPLLVAQGAVEVVVKAALPSNAGKVYVETFAMPATSTTRKYILVQMSKPDPRRRASFKVNLGWSDGGYTFDRGDVETTALRALKTIDDLEIRPEALDTSRPKA